MATRQSMTAAWRETASGVAPSRALVDNRGGRRPVASRQWKLYPLNRRESAGRASIAYAGALQPAVACEAAVEDPADDDDEQHDGGVAEGPGQLWHVREVHPVHAGVQGGD